MGWCMDGEDGSQTMEILMKDNISTDLSMVKEYINGIMDLFFRDYFLMEKEQIILLVWVKAKVNQDLLDQLLKDPDTNLQGQATINISEFSK